MIEAGTNGIVEEPFVTIKTSGYEQYIGAQAAGFCQDSSVTRDQLGDLSSSLQSRLDSLR
jgi:hypothetical protein